MIIAGSNLERIYNMVHDDIKQDIIGYLKNEKSVIFTDTGNHIQIYSNLASEYTHDKVILYFIEYNKGYNAYIAYYKNTGMYTYEQVVGYTIVYSSKKWEDMEEYVNNDLRNFMADNNRHRH
jgi:hypothetical protein